MPRPASLYSLIIAQHSPSLPGPQPPPDYRAGELTIDWIDYHGEKEIFAHEDGDDGKDGNRVMEELVKKQNGRSGGGEGSSYGFEEEEPLLARRSTRGTTSLGPGIIHLFRHAPPLTVLETLEAGDVPISGTVDRRGSVDDDGSVDGAERTAPDGEDGTLVAVLAVPEWMGFDVFGEWLGAWSTRLEGLRMIRDASPNRTLVLLKFEQTKAAEDFISIYTGKTFSSSPERAETCHPVQIYHLLLHDTTTTGSSPSSVRTKDMGTTLPQQSTTSRPVPLLANLLKGIPPQTVYELPTCPVCLERMDSVVTGLITTPCTHIFNCSCLSKWGNGGDVKKRSGGGWCPVCRLSHQRLLAPPPPLGSRATSNNRSPLGRPRSLSSSTGIQETADEPRCMQCEAMEPSGNHPQITTTTITTTTTTTPVSGSAEDQSSPRSNWICVICGYLGCSRYARGHARDHYARTGHAYSMEIDTQRVWDYVEDSYVHRLIQNRSDGKLVELPSAASFVSSRINHHLSALSLVDKHLGFGPSVSDEKKISKLEDMTLEYSYLLSTQLEHQKQQYEAEIAGLKREVREWRSKVGEGDSWRKRFVVEEEKRRAVEERKVPELERAKTMSDKKAQIATDLAKSLQADLGAERALSSGLMEKIKSLETQLAAALVTVEERTGQLKEADEMVRDLMVSISASEQLAGGEAEGTGGTLVVRPGKGARRR